MKFLVKAIASALSALLVAGAAVGAVTWFSDSCTVYMGGHNANLSLQGWGSNATCQSIENSGANAAFKALNLVTFGLVDERAHEGTPQGDVICDGWVRAVHYTVRDYGGLFGTDSVGHALCKSLGAT